MTKDNNLKRFIDEQEQTTKLHYQKLRMAENKAIGCGIFFLKYKV